MVGDYLNKNKDEKLIYKVRKVRNELSKKFYHYQISSSDTLGISELEIKGEDEISEDEEIPPILNGIKLLDEKFAIFSEIINDENTLVAIRAINTLSLFLSKGYSSNERKEVESIMKQLIRTTKYHTLSLFCSYLLNRNKFEINENLKKEIKEAFWLNDQEEIIYRINNEKKYLKRKKLWKGIIFLAIASIIDSIILAVFGDLLANAIYDFYLIDEPFIQNYWFLIILFIGLPVLAIIGYFLYRKIDLLYQIN